jgi:hypothetical protein
VIAMAYFNADGKVVSGKVVGKMGTASKTEITCAVEEAVFRAKHKKYGSALNELRKLFKTYPQLKSESWSVGEHPCSPLIDLYVTQVFR